ncbi:MAG: DUF1559 domain-containing protein [Planctomycetes bacterium]|nr:DUF1559 domain-containing protein [Planctomycetota bacterium]
MKHSVETEPFRPRQRPFRSALPAASNNFQSRQRHALTVMELLVVLSIIGILCALVLPAVQQAREAARQVQCKYNLHQIGVALHAYQAAAGTLPPGWIIETPVRPESLSGWGWLAMALPQMEQGPLFNSINFSHHVGNDSNLTARLTVVEAFLCPTDHAPARVGFYLQAHPQAVVDREPNRRASHRLHRTQPKLPGRG